MRDTMVNDGQLFQPDVILPAQFFPAMRRQVPQEAEYRLVLAILQDAVECYQKHLFARDRKARELFEDARGWIASDDRGWPYSFVNICDLLNLNPDYVRRGLQAWQEHQCAARRSAKTNVVRLQPLVARRDGQPGNETAEAG